MNHLQGVHVKMWKILVVLVIVGRSSAQILLPDFGDYDSNPYFGNFFFGSRPGQIIRQHHGRCQTSDGTGQQGVCLTRPECTVSGGQPQGRQSCILGTCCVYSRGCNQFTSQRVSYFEGTTTANNINNNNNIGNINNNECIYRVRVENSNICQMRLDFDSLNFPAPRRDQVTNTQPPQYTGPYRCQDAFFQVESPNRGQIPTLCGDNDGQHIYVPVNASRGERELVLKVITNNRAASWKVKVTQIECASINKHQKSSRVWEDSFLAAPPGCLQYYQETSRTIRNLGYEPNTLLANNEYQSNLYYATCFRRTSDMCGIDFRVNNFQVGDSTGDGSTVPYCSQQLAAGPPITYRDLDYLFVPNGVLTSVDAQNAPTISYRDRFCGAIAANSVIRSITPGPFYIFFRTDNDVQLRPVVPPNQQTDFENGWELTYSTLFGTCGII